MHADPESQNAESIGDPMRQTKTETTDGKPSTNDVATGAFTPTDDHPLLIGALNLASGTLIGGRYQLIDLLGEGGMGSVYLAEQTEPVKRQVALKVVKAGMDSKTVLARFEAERQALALMPMRCGRPLTRIR